jgi:hypothetical protein
MPHGQAVITTGTAAQNEYNCRVAAATLMNQGWSSQHHFNIMCTDRPVRLGSVAQPLRKLITTNRTWNISKDEFHVSLGLVLGGVTEM